MTAVVFRHSIVQPFTSLLRSRRLNGWFARVTLSTANYNSFLHRLNHLSPWLGASEPQRAASNSVTSQLHPRLELCSGGKKLKVNWSDGEESVFHSLWLRHNCRCPSCWNAAFEQKTIDGEVLQGRPTLVSATVSDVGSDSAVNIRWKYEGDSLVHDGKLHLNWLKENSYSAEKLKKARSDCKPLFTDTMATFSYEVVNSSEEDMWKWLRHLSEYGFALLTDVPTVDSQVVRVCESVGLVHKNYYGDMFDVKVLPGADDIGSSSRHLSYHADVQHLENPPGLQMLHCMRFDECVEGGETILYDYYRVACEMREKYPREFDSITRIPCNFQRYYKEGKDRVMMRIRAPLIVLSELGDIVTLRLHPHGEGPILASEEDIEKFYEAYKCLWRLFNETKHQYSRRLRPGEALTFNNRRMVHARTPIVSNGGVRHLQGAYVNIDDFKSKVRVLASKFGPPGYRVKNVFNSDCL